MRREEWEAKYGTYEAWRASVYADLPVCGTSLLYGDAINNTDLTPDPKEN